MLELWEQTAPLPDATPQVYPVLCAMEDAAKAHIEALGFSRPAVLAHYNAIWMIARAQLSFSAPPQPALPLTVRTWLRPISRGVFFRDFDLLQGGSPIGEGTQTWVLVDVDSRRMLRMEDIAALLALPTRAVKSLRPGRIVLPGTIYDAAPLCAGQDAVDENGHINNAAYVRLALAPLPCRPVRLLKLCYHRECFAGQQIPRKLWAAENEAFVHLSTPTGEAAFDLQAEFF